LKNFIKNIIGERLKIVILNKLNTRFKESWNIVLMDKDGNIISNKILLFEIIGHELNEDYIMTAIISEEAIGEEAFELDINDGEFNITMGACKYQFLSELKELVEEKLDNKYKIYSFHSTTYNHPIHYGHNLLHMSPMVETILDEEKSNTIYAYTIGYEHIRERILNVCRKCVHENGDYNSLVLENWIEYLEEDGI